MSPSATIEVTKHAANRYGERVRTAAASEPARARAEIAQLVRSGTLQADPPPWMLADAHRYPPDTRYVMIGPDVAMVVRPALGPTRETTVVITVMTPWDQGACHVAERRRHRATRNQRKHQSRTPHTIHRPRFEDDGGYDIDEWSFAD